MLLKALGLQKDHGKAAAASHSVERSPHWSSVVKKFLITHGHCAACDSSTVWHGIFAHQVHHIHAFHYCVLLGRPDLELDERNLISMCQVPGTHHHLLLGHYGSFLSYAPEVEELVSRYKGWSRSDIEADPHYRRAAANRPKAWNDMTQTERLAMRAALDRKLPPDPNMVALAARLAKVTLPVIPTTR